MITDYKRISCGCCTGRPILRVASWGSWEDRTEQCVCWVHQDRTRGLAPNVCPAHAARVKEQQS
jgi:hypothetical protein